MACLAMVAAYWGHKTDLSAMRRQFSISIKGTSLKTLMRMASVLGLTTRALKVDLDQLSSLRMPCILHWGMVHFVVLREVGNRHATIHDPAIGERRVSMAEMSRQFSGVALELLPGDGFCLKDDRQKFSLRSLMGRVVGLRRSATKLLALGLTLQVFSLVLPFYLQWMVDEALVASDRNMISVLGLSFLALVAIQSLASGVRSWVTTTMTTDLNFQWLGNAFAHLFQLPLPYFEKRHIGDLVSRFGSIQTIQRSLTTQFIEAIVDGCLVTVTLVVMLFYNWGLCVVSIGAVIAYAAVKAFLFTASKDAQQETIVNGAKQQTHFIESANAIQNIRLFNREEVRRIGWQNKLANQFNAELRAARLTVFSQIANNIIFSAERVLIIWLGAIAVLSNNLTVGMLFAFLSFREQFSQRIAALVDKLFEFGIIKLHGERLADILLTDPENNNSIPNLSIDSIEPTIELRNVWFRYSDHEPFVLKGISIKVEARECLAITGASGCGKTTLLKILLGLIEPTRGEILIGNLSIKQIGIKSFRSMLGTVMQEDTLFAGSIKENISFFDPMPEEDRVLNSAYLAAIHSEIVKMPMQYNTLVGGVGFGLSGGQKQRILLARALYKNPKILILDEATSHLDAHNEKAVNSAINILELTRIIVAHRAETIASAHRVIVLDHGVVASDFAGRNAA